METTLDMDESLEPQKRPVFLTVICILTWVGSGMALFSGAMGFLSSTAQSDYNEIVNTPGADRIVGVMAPFEEFLLWTNISNASAIIASILCIIGALLMFQQKKSGFLLYLGGCIISIVVGAIAVNVLMPSLLAWVGILAVVLNVLICAAFIIMYAVNLKHMK